MKNSFFREAVKTKNGGRRSCNVTIQHNTNEPKYKEKKVNLEDFGLNPYYTWRERKNKFIEIFFKK